MAMDKLQLKKSVVVDLEMRVANAATFIDLLLGNQIPEYSEVTSRIAAIKRARQKRISLLLELLAAQQELSSLLRLDEKIDPLDPMGIIAASEAATAAGEGDPISLKLKEDKNGRQIYVGSEDDCKRAARVMSSDGVTIARTRKHGKKGNWILIVIAGERWQGQQVAA